MTSHRSTQARSARASASAFVCLCAFLLGCGDDDEPGCTGQLPTCDIVDGDCRRRVFRETACIRDRPDDAMPTVRILTVSEVEAEFRQLLGEDAGDTDPWSSGWGQLGLVDSTQALDEAIVQTLVANVAAYYEPSTGNVTVIDHGNPSPQDDPWILSHEFVHALQDRAVDLPRFRSQWVDSTDSEAAIDCLVEGEATTLSTVLLLPSLGASARTFNWRAFGNEIIQQTLEDIALSSSPLLDAAFGLSYGIGSANLGETFVQGGLDAIIAHYDAPRTALLEWLVPAAPEPLDCYPTEPPLGYAPYDHDTLGVTGLIALYASLGFDGFMAYGEAQQWRNDSLVLFVDDADETQVAVAWRIRMETASNATRLADAAEGALTSTATVELDGRDVIIRTANDPTAFDAWSSAGCGASTDLPVAPDESADIQASAGRGVLGRLGIARPTPRRRMALNVR